MKIENREVYEQAIVKFGKPSQIEMLIEELAELQLALQKFKRDPSPEKAFHVCDEMADVEIMLEQNKLIFSEEQIKERKEFKLNRLRETLSNSMYSKYSMDSSTLEKIAKGE